MRASWQAWVLGIAASLLVSGIGTVIALAYAQAGESARVDQRVTAVEARSADHDDAIRDLVPLLRVIEARSADMVRRLERVEQKVDDAPRARRK